MVIEKKNMNKMLTIKITQDKYPLIHKAAGEIRLACGNNKRKVYLLKKKYGISEKQLSLIEHTLASLTEGEFEDFYDNPGNYSDDVYFDLANKKNINDRGRSFKSAHRCLSHFAY